MNETLAPVCGARGPGSLLGRAYTSALSLVFGLGLLVITATVSAAPAKERTFCIFDPVGANGVFYQIAQNYVIQANAWGYKLKPRAYTDEQVAARDFKAGRCDLAALTGIKTINFVKFAGSLDMVGGLQTYDQERTAIRVMSSPKAAPYMQENGYEVVGVMPFGKVFIFARRKQYLDSLADSAGKKIAVLTGDKQQTTIVDAAGASAVNASIATFGPMFTNGSVDMAFAPAIAYDGLELSKGLGQQGGIADLVLSMLSVQIIVHQGRFPDDFGARSRRWVIDHLFDKALVRMRAAEDDVLPRHWVDISPQNKARYVELLRRARGDLWASGWYDHRMQHLLKKIRCDSDSARAECSQATEGGAAN
ncbi:RND transporter [Salinisphaera japonica YTM-1]|uniref:RND transporter n=2 Tax=Salinisphaera TaxID=180541 RepID=A0A423Q1D2_9GAMM|nr:RND transporter [Salinisphaera japonica YTM-1]